MDEKPYISSKSAITFYTQPQSGWDKTPEYSVVNCTAIAFHDNIFGGITTCEVFTRSQKDDRSSGSTSEYSVAQAINKPCWQLICESKFCILEFPILYWVLWWDDLSSPLCFEQRGQNCSTWSPIRNNISGPISESCDKVNPGEHFVDLHVSQWRISKKMWLKSFESSQNAHADIA